MASSPHAMMALMLVLWAISDNIVMPVLGAVVGLGICAYVERHHRAEAWAFIPRRRQHPGRDEPALWSVVAKLFPLCALAWALGAYVSALGAREAATLAGPVAVGALAALALAELAALLWDRLAPRERRVDAAPAAVATAFAFGSVLVLANGIATILDRSRWEQSGFLMGAGVLVTYVTLLLLVRLVPRRIRCVPARLLPT
ncbi:hypothetical protein [Microbacterium lushaniae]|uniref:Uncharacterized protein n=1 Tax=Microbacterium lushaniae TaxID=2614639 RepID=A0A5J6L0A3_9MICO|nr:hypothetical protein [Microbacterium lushaniae]QEW01933.1 hypothetical protein F6J85_01680 [Microbacterium lushaniae]